MKKYVPVFIISLFVFLVLPVFASDYSKLYTKKNGFTSTYNIFPMSYSQNFITSLQSCRNFSEEKNVTQNGSSAKFRNIVYGYVNGKCNFEQITTAESALGISFSMKCSADNITLKKIIYALTTQGQNIDVSNYCTLGL